MFDDPNVDIVVPFLYRCFGGTYFLCHKVLDVNITMIDNIDEDIVGVVMQVEALLEHVGGRPPAIRTIVWELQTLGYNWAHRVINTAGRAPARTHLIISFIMIMVMIMITINTHFQSGPRCVSRPACE